MLNAEKWYACVPHFFTMGNETRWYISVAAAVAIFALALARDARKRKKVWQPFPRSAQIVEVCRKAFPKLWASSAGFWLAMWLLQNGVFEGYSFGITAWFAIVVCTVPAVGLLLISEAEALPAVVVSIILAILSGTVYGIYGAFGFWGVFWTAGGGAVAAYIAKGFPNIYNAWWWRWWWRS